MYLGFTHIVEWKQCLSRTPRTEGPALRRSAQGRVHRAADAGAACHEGLLRARESGLKRGGSGREPSADGESGALAPGASGESPAGAAEGLPADAATMVPAGAATPESWRPAAKLRVTRVVDEVGEHSRMEARAQRVEVGQQAQVDADVDATASDAANLVIIKLPHHEDVVAHLEAHTVRHGRARC